MKSKIFLYLFIFVSLICLYLFVSNGNMVKAKDARINKLGGQIEQLRDSVRDTQLKVLEMQYFSLENNDDALAYYDHLELEDPSRYIADKLLETNESKGDNPLVPYEGMDSDFKINKIKVLNHKWILTDFSDGKYWGELLIKYELKDDLSVDFTMLDHLLYTRSE
ncbi:hydrolase [Zobellia galactanivorans]|uniref:hydrolase n=1 Tax=Zobellia galactanivorans (strain DSM 12802 / CCUG 47099 / CIP 106680 / NCIMB 13871 / Dsij) TaxID=63186 RepID=UPI0026E1D11E|nr:hydrolase [Zobellia galactanivorans]MDO6807786.1 hydrolase [Zobellia galactanivorans]